MTLDEATRVAVDPHAGQLDKAGKPHVSHAHDADHDAYVEKLTSDPLARAVKVADLHDNLDVTRIQEVTERGARRITKYLRSLRRSTAPSGGQGA